MRVDELNPRWVISGGEGVTMKSTGQPIPLQERVGMSFDCPCGCDTRGFVTFAHDADGQDTQGTCPKWARTGEDFADITLAPSIQRQKIGGLGCDWHGFFKNGEVEHC